MCFSEISWVFRTRPAAFRHGERRCFFLDAMAARQLVPAKGPPHRNTTSSRPAPAPQEFARARPEHNGATAPIRARPNGLLKLFFGLLNLVFVLIKGCFLSGFQILMVSSLFY